MSFRFFPPAAFAACFLAAAAVAGEIPAYEDFSHPLAFSAVSGGREAEDGAFPARADIAVSFLARDEDTWWEGLLHRRTASAVLAPYTPPRADGAERDSSRNWLADALAKPRAGPTDIASSRDDSGDWLSGDLARMARKRTEKETAEKERPASGEETAADDPAALWTPPDSARFQPFASADGTARGAATNAPGGRDGNGARASRDPRRAAADARD
ncbi:MAG: hypothetical protein IJS32_03830, partial [Kiritimatiellae bacterium]|nr:hypothetical protein [Kiritimatiellia bacterium]